MTNKKRFGGESIRLNINVGTGNRVNKRGLSNVGVTTKDNGTSGRVNRRQTGQMLTNLLKVSERRLQLLDDSTHSTQSSPLQLLALVQRSSELHHTDILLSDVITQLLGNIDLTQSQLVMISVVQDVHQISVEGVDVVHDREVIKDVLKLVMVTLLTELHLPDVKRTNTGDGIPRMDNGRGFSLSFGEDNVNELRGSRNNLDPLEIVEVFSGHDEETKKKIKHWRN